MGKVPIVRRTLPVLLHAFSLVNWADADISENSACGCDRSIERGLAAFRHAGLPGEAIAICESLGAAQVVSIRAGSQPQPSFRQCPVASMQC